MGAIHAAFGDFLLDALVHGQAHRFIKVALRTFQFDGAGNFGFGGEIEGDLLLAATEDEGADAPCKVLAAVGITDLLDGSAVNAAELFLGAQVAGREERHEAPELAEVVFHGGAGHAEAVACRKGAWRRRPIWCWGF